ncbi:MAG: PAS domain S-box protein [Chitinophagaceae bacterium]
MKKDNNPYRILVVEDNPGDWVIIEDFLSDQILAPAIIQVDSFAEASGILNDPKTTFDIILLDLSLPDKNGQELITAMLQINSASPIIILTGYTDIEFSIKSISQGIFDYLLKDDLTAITLYKSITYAIERKKAISQLKDSEKRYSDLFNLSPQPMWVFNAETFAFIQVNKAASALYGYTEQEFLNMTLMDVKMEDDIATATKEIRKPIEGDGSFKSTVMHQKKSGEIINVEIYSTPIIIDHKAYRSVIAIDVTEKNQHEHNIIKAIIKTQEDERYEIGGELHDNVCQLLAISQMNLGMLKQGLAESKIIMFDKLSEHIKTAIEEIRNISHRLAPAFFNDTTLEEAFGILFDNFNIEGKYKILLHFNEAARKYKIPLDIQQNLYRILQEQLRNIMKYSKASEIEVDMVIHNNKLKMRVADNGVGFNLMAVKKGIGLANIRRRAELFYGSSEINSSPGNGCEIGISIPLPLPTN